MLDKERIKLMTRLAAFEQQEESSVFRVNSYMKSDYVILHVIYTLFTTSLAFLLITAVIVLARYNYVLGNLNNTNILKIGGLFLGSWVIFEVIFSIIAYAFYSNRYKKCRMKMNNYVNDLRKLDQMYADSVK